MWTNRSIIITSLITIAFIPVLYFANPFFLSGHVGQSINQTTNSLDNAYSSCVGGNITVHVKNIGNNEIDTFNITLSGTQADGTTPLIYSDTAADGRCDSFANHHVLSNGNITGCSNKLTQASSSNNILIKLIGGNNVSAKAFCPG